MLINLIEYNQMEGVFDIIEENRVDVILTDYSQSPLISISFLEIVMESYPSIFRVMICGLEDYQKAINLLIKGLITTYFEKPFFVSFLLL